MCTQTLALSCSPCYIDTRLWWKSQKVANPWKGETLKHTKHTLIERYHLRRYVVKEHDCLCMTQSRTLLLTILPPYLIPSLLSSTVSTAPVAWILGAFPLCPMSGTGSQRRKPRRQQLSCLLQVFVPLSTMTKVSILWEQLSATEIPWLTASRSERHLHLFPLWLSSLPMPHPWEG